MLDAKAPDFHDLLLGQIPGLRAYARALTHHREDADDLVQQTLLKAIVNIEKFRPDTNLRAWLFTIMRNSFLTNIRKQNREKPGDKDCVSLDVKTQPHHDAYITGQRLQIAMSRLPRQYQELLVLILVIGESYETAAQVCNCAVGTVKSRLNRARKMLIADLAVTDIHDLLHLS